MLLGEACGCTAKMNKLSSGREKAFAWSAPHWCCEHGQCSYALQESPGRLREWTDCHCYSDHCDGSSTTPLADDVVGGHPRCVDTGLGKRPVDTALPSDNPSDPHRPDCTCCESGLGAMCPPGNSIVAFFWVLALLWIYLILDGDPGGSDWRHGEDSYPGGSDWRRMVATITSEHRDKYAAWFDAFTSELCTGEVEIMFHASFHGKTAKKQSVHEPWQRRFEARECCAVPLAVKRGASSLVEVWRAESRVTQTRCVLEVRPRLSVSCATSASSGQLSADWEAFKRAHTDDGRRATVFYWATVDVKTTLGHASDVSGRRAFALGSVPAALGPRLYTAARLCGLGWLYRLWYATQNVVVDMPLHREISTTGSGAPAGMPSNVGSASDLWRA